MRSWTGLVLAGLAVAALSAGAGAVAGDGGDGATGAVAPNATTLEPQFVTATGAGLAGEVSVAKNGTNWAAWIEFRVRSSDGDWNRTRSRNASVVEADGDRWTFRWNASDLRPATAYEYRTLVATTNGSDTGAVRAFTTDGSVDGPASTPTATPVPCPSYRGASGFLCTTTPTPTPTPAAEGHSEVSPEDRSPGPSGGGASRGSWVTPLLPHLAWAAAVVVAPLVLGGLLWIDSVRRGRA